MGVLSSRAPCCVVTEGSHLSNSDERMSPLIYRQKSSCRTLLELLILLLADRSYAALHNCSTGSQSDTTTAHVASAYTFKTTFLWPCQGHRRSYEVAPVFVNAHLSSVALRVGGTGKGAESGHATTSSELASFLGSDQCPLLLSASGQKQLAENDTSSGGRHRPRNGRVRGNEVSNHGLNRCTRAHWA